MTYKNHKLMAFANEHREQHPKKIILNVGATAFGQIEAGTKTMEMRLKKDSQTRISPGDIIIFQLQTGEEQKAGDEVALEKPVKDVRIHLGIEQVVEKEEVKFILPSRPDKKEFLKKAREHYKKAAKGIDISTAPFEVIEFN